jgi:hypothetical protein
MWTPPPDQRKSHQKTKTPPQAEGFFYACRRSFLFGFNLLRLCDALIALAA